MPCREMKELEASLHGYKEAALLFTRIDVRDLSGGMPYGEARVSYTMQVHRQSCVLCRKP